MPRIVIEGAGEQQDLYQAVIPLFGERDRDSQGLGFLPARCGREALPEWGVIEQGVAPRNIWIRGAQCEWR
jgi:hypothetical protein